MKLPSTLLLLLLSLTLVSAKLVSDDRTTRRPRKGGMKEVGKPLLENRDRQPRSVSSQSNLECQRGNPLGASYSGTTNVTASGTPCQAWTLGCFKNTLFSKTNWRNSLRLSLEVSLKVSKEIFDLDKV